MSQSVQPDLAVPPIRRLLLVRLDHIGDFLLTVPPLVNALGNVAPDLEISLLTTARSATLARSIPGVKQVHVYDPPWSVSDPDGTPFSRLQYAYRAARFSLQAALNRFGRYDALVHLSFSAPEKILCRLLAPIRAGFRGPYSDRLHPFAASALTHSVAFDTTEHLLTNCRTLLETILPLEIPETYPVTPVPASVNADDICFGDMAIQPPFLGIHPGGEGSFKNWPLSCFAELARQLVTKTGMACVLLGGPDQAESVQWIMHRTAMSGIQAIITSNFASLARRVAGLKLFIANDGGPAHLGAALGTPTVVLFGPTDERIYGPRGPHVTTIRSQVPDPRLDYPWASGTRAIPAASLQALTVEAVLAHALNRMETTRTTESV